MKIRQHVQGEVSILVPDGKIVLGDGDQELSEAVRRALDEGARKIIINFEHVSYLDSSGVGELVGCYTSIRNKDGKLWICNLNARVLNLIRMTSLHSVFQIAASEEEALAGS